MKIELSFEDFKKLGDVKFPFNVNEFEDLQSEIRSGFRSKILLGGPWKFFFNKILLFFFFQMKLEILKWNIWDNFMEIVQGEFFILQQKNL